jgi:hypothetical protein
LLIQRNSRSPFDFAQGRLSTPLRSGRDDEFMLIALETEHLRQDTSKIEP